jgi:thiamine kinase-like enzyme
LSRIKGSLDFSRGFLVYAAETRFPEKAARHIDSELEWHMPTRQQHRQEIQSLLQKHLSMREPIFSLPSGSGMETYFVQGDKRDYFVKVGAPPERYLTLAEIGLTPPVLASGQLESGASIIIQPRIKGRKPTHKDYWDQLEKVASIIRIMHNHSRIKKILPPAPSALHRDTGQRALLQLRQTWDHYKGQIPSVAGFVENSMEYLAQQVNLFSTEGLVASHNDICNANWIFAVDGAIYLIDLDSMSMDDPALDLGAFLWWYYPPELRGRFLTIAGYSYDDEFRLRMRIRRTIHCLQITLPREKSFDCFTPDYYDESLDDFQASLEGKENPKGYGGC